MGTLYVISLQSATSLNMPLDDLGLTPMAFIFDGLSVV